MAIPKDYAARVYAGVLGKIIGVYLGRPFEMWTHEQILSSLGEIRSYVNDRADLPLRNHLLVVTDDDISGTFTFLRALPDYGNSLELTPAQIGQTWLNYIIENRTILWWGGLGNSTEHTAYLRLKDGIPAPRSGSKELNGQVVAEQIGAQIFIDGWGLVCPGNPALAADLARRAASVSHDGEAIYAAQVIAALIAQAFVEWDLDLLLDTALALVPAESTISRLVADIRAWHAANPSDWYAARARLAATYGYDKYGGNCHVIPNHGLVILALLYSGGDFSLAQTIVNTCGWDTDCNAANVGCILGVRNGLSAFESGPDWRGPVADRLYLSTADGGRAISDALRETDFIMKSACALQGEKWTAPKAGARFHFSLPGAVQGFRCNGNITLENVPHPLAAGQRALELRYQLAPGQSASTATPTFIPPEAITMPGYALLASPTLYPGQVIRARVGAGAENGNLAQVGLVIQHYAKDDLTVARLGPERVLSAGEWETLEWRAPNLDGAPIAAVGISISTETAAEGCLYIDWLTWDGAAEVAFQRAPGQMWRRQWVNAADYFTDEFGEAFRLIQNRGRGLVMTGTREWMDYCVQAVITPHLAESFGLAARVQGQERYYALLLTGGASARLVKRLDGETILSETPFAWQFGQPYDLRLELLGSRISAWVNGLMLFSVEDAELTSGGVGLVCESGRVGTEWVRVSPYPSPLWSRLGGP
jgi:ADP-ribosylglycohydrolase